MIICIRCSTGSSQVAYSQNISSIVHVPMFVLAMLLPDAPAVCAWRVNHLCYEFLTSQHITLIPGLIMWASEVFGTYHMVIPPESRPWEDGVFNDLSPMGLGPRRLGAEGFFFSRRHLKILVSAESEVIGLENTTVAIPNKSSHEGLVERDVYRTTSHL